MTQRLLLGPAILEEAILVPPEAPIPLAIWGHTQPEFCPYSWRTFLGGTPFARMVKKENGGECVCWQGESLWVPVSLCQTSSHTQMSA